MPWSDISFSLRNLPVRAFDPRAQGFSPLLAVLIAYSELVLWRARRRMVLPANGLSCVRRLGGGGGVEGSN